MNRRRFAQRLAGACCACLSLNCSPALKDEQKADGRGKAHLAAACGTYCGACPAYIAKHGGGGKKRPETGPRQGQPSGPAATREGVPPSNWMAGLLCDGCLSGGELAPHCLRCEIRQCAERGQNDSRCTNCGALPCARVTKLIDMGRYFHRGEYLPNLARMREMGVEEWVRCEEARWRCPRCGRPLCWYDAECAGCGEPRPGRLFPLFGKPIE